MSFNSFNSFNSKENITLNNSIPSNTSSSDELSLNWTHSYGVELNNDYSLASESLPIWATESGVYIFWDPIGGSEILEKIDLNGNSLWNSTWASPEGETCAKDLWSDGTYLYGCGETPISTYPYSFVVKWDLDGNELKQSVWGDETKVELPKAIWGDGTYIYVISYVYTVEFPRSHYIILNKLNATSLASVAITPISNENYELNPNTMVSDGEFLYIIGYAYDPLNYINQQMVICVNFDGEIQWEKYYEPAAGWSYGMDGVIVDNALYVVGYTTDNGYALSLCLIDLVTGDLNWVVSIPETGDFIETSTYGYGIASDSTHLFTVGSYGSNSVLMVMWDLEGNMLNHLIYAGSSGPNPLSRSISILDNVIFTSNFRYEPDPETGGESFLVYPELNKILLTTSNSQPEESLHNFIYLNWTVFSPYDLAEYGDEKMPLWATNTGVYTFFGINNSAEKLEKRDSNGQLLWKKSFVTDHNESAAQDLWSDGSNLYGCGSTLDAASITLDAFLVKWDMNGNEIKTQYLGNSTSSETGKSIWGDGTFIYMMSSFQNLSSPYSGILITKFDKASLTPLWNVSLYQGYANVSLNPETMISDGTHLYIIGQKYYYDPIQNFKDIGQFISCLNFDGSISWQRLEQISSGSTMAYDGVIVNNSLYVLGYDDGLLSQQLNLRNLDKNTGESIWNLTYADTNTRSMTTIGFGIASNSTHLFTVGVKGYAALLCVYAINGTLLYNLTYGQSDYQEPYCRSIAVYDNLIYTSYMDIEEIGVESYVYHPAINQFVINQTRKSILSFVPSAPHFITSSQNITNNSMVIRWNAISGAEKYQLFINASFITNTTDTFYNWTTNSNGIYIFTVKAINGSGESISSQELIIIVTISNSDSPFFTPVIVLGATFGSVLGIGLSQVPQANQVLTKEFWKKRRYLSKTDRAPPQSSLNSSSNNLAPNDLPQNKLTQTNIAQNNVVITGSNLNFNDIIGSLKAMWDNVPGDLQDLLIKGMDRYLKFKDEAELALMTTFYNLSQGFLDVCHLYRDGNFTESLSKLKEIEQKSHEIKFTDLSDEAKLMQTESIKKIKPGGAQ